MSTTERKITNLAELENEILRQKLKAKEIGDQLNQNFEYLQDHFSSMAFNSMFRKRNGTGKRNGKLFDSVWDNEKVQNGFNRIVDHLTDRALEGLKNFVDRILHK